MKNTNSSRINFNAFRNAPSFAEANSNSPFTADLTTAMDAEHAEYLLLKEAFDKWAEATKVGDAEVPYMNGKKFRDLITVETHPSGNRMVTLNKGGKAGVTGSNNTWAAVNALIDGFATRRYGRQFVFNCHTRLFDPSLPRESDVRTVREDDRYERYDWIAHAWKRSTPQVGSDEFKKWSAKHEQLDLMLTSLSRDYEFHIVFYLEAQWNTFKRNVIDRMDLTIAQALKEKSDDWSVADAAGKINAQGKKLEAEGKPLSVVVDGLDLRAVSMDVVVLIKTPLCNKPYEKVIRHGNTADIAAIAFVLGQGEAKGYSVTLKQ